MGIISVWDYADAFEINTAAYKSATPAYAKVACLTKFTPTSSLTITKHNRLALKGRNTADITAVEDTYDVEGDYLPKGEDAGSDAILSLVGKMGDEAKRECRYTDPYSKEVVEFVAAFELKRGDGDNVITFSGSAHVDGIPTVKAAATSAG